MPSQEEYLDNLLKDLSNIEEAATETPATETPEVPDLENIKDITELPEAPKVDDISGMSEEEIEKLLDAGSNYHATAGDLAEETVTSEESDLMDLLQEMKEEELQDIHAMLEKADNNEAVDDEIVNLLQEEDSHEGDEAIALLLKNDEPEPNERQLKKETAQEKKRLTQEKKRQLKEEKRRLKEQKRLEKQAAKAKAKAEKADLKEDNTTENAAEHTASEDNYPGGDLTAMLSEEPAVDDLSAGLETIDLGIDEDAMKMEPDLLEALTIADDIFGGDSFDISSLEKVPHEKIADEEIDKIKKKGKKDKSKNGFFSKVFEFLTESDDDDEDEKSEIKLSQENENILKEMDSEKGKKKKSKKKNKKGEASGENEEEGEEEDKKAKKAKKEKKPKKEKAPKVSVIEEPGKKLSKKRVSLILLICLTICFVIIVINNVIGDYSAKKTAKTAYYNEDFQTCYQNLYGKALSESEQVMYYKSESILRMRVWIREYEIFAKEGSELEALDSLIQTVDDYPTLFDFASEWNAATEVASLYDTVLQILSDKYHLTETQAKEIAATPDDVTYTKKIMALVAGEAYDSWDTPKVPETPDKQEDEENTSKLPDVLSEEEDLTDTEFVDNIQ